jgi:hypothetical protein
LASRLKVGEHFKVEATLGQTTGAELQLSFKLQALSMKKDLAERSSMLSIKPPTEAQAAAEALEIRLRFYDGLDS